MTDRTDPHFRPAFATSQLSVMTMRHAHRCAGPGGFFDGVAKQLLTMNMKNIVVSCPKHIRQSGIRRCKPESAESFGEPGRRRIMVNYAARGQGLAFIVTACTCRLVKNEIHLQLRMPLAKNINEPGFNAPSTET